MGTANRTIRLASRFHTGQGARQDPERHPANYAGSSCTTYIIVLQRFPFWDVVPFFCVPLCVRYVYAPSSPEKQTVGTYKTRRPVVASSCVGLACGMMAWPGRATFLFANTEYIPFNHPSSYTKSAKLLVTCSFLTRARSLATCSDCCNQNSKIWVLVTWG